MADCRWINANGGNWNTAANWSTGTVPTAADNAIVDAASFAANGKVITIDAIANCLNFDCSGADQTFTIANSAYAFNVYGSFTGSANLTMTFTGTGYYYSKDTGIITQAGALLNWNRWYIDGLGITVTNADDMQLGQMPIYHINGTWDQNGKNIAISGAAGIYNIEAGTKTLTPNGSVFSVGTWKNLYPTNFTFNSTSGTVIITRTASTLAGTTTFYNLTLLGQAGVTAATILTANITVRNTLTATGNNDASNRLLIQSDTIGTPRTISCNGTIVASNIDFRDITLAGTANRDLSAITGGSGDCGGNSGITFTPAQPQWYKHTSGACNWSDATKWFSNQAKTIPGRVPLPQDDTIFDSNSFTGTSYLYLNCPRIGKSLDMSGVSKPVTVYLMNDTEIHGSFILGDNVSPSFGFILYLMGRSNFIFNSYGKNILWFRVRAFGGIYINQSNLLSTRNGYSINIENGTFDFNDYDSVLGGIYCVAGTTFLGNGTMTLQASSPSFNLFSSLASASIFPELSTIILKPPSGSLSFGFNGSGKTYHKLWISGSHSGQIIIIDSNSFFELLIDAGRSLGFIAAITTTVNKFTAIGTAAKPITIVSTTNAQHTLALADGNQEVECDYLNISYSKATANKFFAGSHSVNSGNNTGWIFADMARFFTWASASGIGSAAATLQLKNLLQAIASGTSSAQAALLQLRQMVALAAGITTTDLQLYASRYITAIATGQATADSFVNVLLPIASEAQGTSAASLAMHQLIYALANAAGISVTEATLLIYAYPVEIFEAISKITTVVEARSAITAIIQAKSTITTEFTQNSKVF